MWVDLEVHRLLEVDWLRGEGSKEKIEIKDNTQVSAQWDKGRFVQRSRMVNSFWKWNEAPVGHARGPVQWAGLQSDLKLKDNTGARVRDFGVISS